MKTVIICFAAAILAGGLQYGLVKYDNKSNLSRFNLSNEQLAENLGKSQIIVPIPHSQVWPFDTNQEITVKTLSRKQVGDNIVVATELTVLADVPRNNKEKLPDKVMLSGVAKLHYELIGKEWFLINVDNVSLKAKPYKLP